MSGYRFASRIVLRTKNDDSGERKEMGNRSKRVRLNIVIDVDFVPETAEGFGGMKGYGRHIADLLELSDGDYIDEDGGDDFSYELVDVEVADT